jgi:hypothetical protein
MEHVAVHGEYGLQVAETPCAYMCDGNGPCGLGGGVSYEFYLFRRARAADNAGTRNSVNASVERYARPNARTARYYYYQPCTG